MIDWLYDKCVRAKILPYRPQAYWERRGGESYVRFGNRIPVDRTVAQVNFFARLIDEMQPVNRLLDFGCGTGRMFPVWGDVQHVYAFDFSESQRLVARRVASGISISGPNGNGPSVLPFPDNTFDLVASCEVLLHIRPEHLLSVLMEIVRVLRPGGRLAAITTPPGSCGAGHNFDHDYPAAFEAAGLSIQTDLIRCNQRYLVGLK